MADIGDVAQQKLPSSAQQKLDAFIADEMANHACAKEEYTKLMGTAPTWEELMKFAAFKKSKLAEGRVALDLKKPISFEIKKPSLTCYPYVEWELRKACCICPPCAMCPGFFSCPITCPCCFPLTICCPFLKTYPQKMCGCPKNNPCCFLSKFCVPVCACFSKPCLVIHPCKFPRCSCCPNCFTCCLPKTVGWNFPCCHCTFAYCPGCCPTPCCTTEKFTEVYHITRNLEETPPSPQAMEPPSPQAMERSGGLALRRY